MIQDCKIISKQQNMKALVEYIEESSKISSLDDYINEAAQSIDIKSDIIEMKVPNGKITKLAKLLSNEGFDVSGDMYLSLDSKDLTPFVCKCKILDKNKVLTFKGSDWDYYIESGSNYIPSNDKATYVKITNAKAYTKQKSVNIEDCGHCTKSDDKALDFYWISHYAEGSSLNVVADPEQVALAIIIDLSARTAKMEMEKK